MVCQSPLAVRQERQVITRDIDRLRRQPGDQADAEPPVTMRAPPVGGARDEHYRAPALRSRGDSSYFHSLVPGLPIARLCYSLRELRDLGVGVSFARAIEQPALEIWQGKKAQVLAAQHRRRPATSRCL